MSIDRATSPSDVRHGDSLATARTLPDASIDLIYMDPPFGTGTVRRGRGPGLHYVDAGGAPDAFAAWLRPWLVESHRVLAPTGSLMVHLDYRGVHYVKVALDQVFGVDAFVNEIIWCYAVGGKSRRGFARKHDTILWYARTPAYAFYPEAVAVPRRAGSHMKVERDLAGAAVQTKVDRRTGKVYRYPVAVGKIPEDWWTDIETLNHSDKQRTGWPTQKPERLLERLIHATTAPGDLVADWFAGSGTTAAVAARLGRRTLAVDASAEAIALIRTRLAAVPR